MRSRNIKPGFFKNEYLAELSPLSRILFIGLWCMADREGRLEYRPKRIRAEILPYDSCDVEKLLEELESTSDTFIRRYEVDGCQYIDIPNFNKHQSPHKNEKPSEYPAFPESPEITRQKPDNYDTNRPDIRIEDIRIDDSMNADSSEKAAAVKLFKESFRMLVPAQPVVDEVMSLVEHHGFKAVKESFIDAAAGGKTYPWAKARIKNKEADDEHFIPNERLALPDGRRPR